MTTPATPLRRMRRLESTSEAGAFVKIDQVSDSVYVVVGTNVSG
jgi:hypothetical protein